MIVRPRIPASVRYTHDEEAMTTVWSEMREFAGVSVEQMTAWVEPERIFGWSKAYWHWPADDVFADAATYIPEPYRTNADLVSLWRIDEFTRHVLETHGFSCVLCGARSEWEKRGKLYGAWDDPILEAVNHRQGLWAPPLVCRECAIDVPAILSPFIKDIPRKKAVNRLIERIVPFGPRRAA